MGGGTASPWASKLSKVKRDGFLNILDGLCSGLPLRNAAGQRRDFGDKDAVLVLLNQDPILHHATSRHILRIPFTKGKGFYAR